MMGTLPQSVQRPALSDEQKRVLLAATAELIAATANERSPSLPDPSLAGTAETPLSGVFVSLKRQKQLRACTGGLRPNLVPLGVALADAVESTVLRDTRFPPVSSGEVAFLDVEVWLLFNPQPVPVIGEARQHAVTTGGKHGLVVSRGQQHGLLLPGVAVDHGWDSKTFLEQVCVKAGLHPSLWKDDSTSILTFEGEVIQGPLSDFVQPEQAPPITERDELHGYFDFCWDNIVLAFQGATPLYFNPSLRDITVNGATLTLRLPQLSSPVHVTQLSLRPGSPVQNMLVQLANAGARQLAGRGVQYGLLSNLRMGLTLYGDPHFHGTVEHADLRGFDSAKRAFLVVERNKQGIVFRPGSSPEEVLAEAAREAQVTMPASSSVVSMQAFSTDKSLTLSTAPQPRRGPAERPAGVAGTFYPAQPELLSSLVDQLLARSEPEALPVRSVAAAMVPHAGLTYSGTIAARVLQSLELPPLIIILGPKHTPNGMDWAVAPHETWKIPGDDMAGDFILARQLVNAIPGLHLDAAAHEREHAIEVELPLLARLAPQSRVLGIVLAGGDWSAAQRFAEGFVTFLEKITEPYLLLISSDMNHFATDEENRRLDEIALSALERLEPEAALRVIQENNISMCGVFPAVIVMETLRRQGRLRSATRCGYATSAEVSGDTARVVGYAGLLFD